MSKYVLSIESRDLFFDKSPESVAELVDVTAVCNFRDDGESNNDFDINVYSDSERFAESVSYNTSEQVNTEQKGGSISGTRTSATVFTRASGTWDVDALIGWRVFAYVDGSESSGSWLPIVDNNATTITISGTLPASCNRIKLQPKAKLRNFVQIIPRAGLWGTFFKYKIDKNVPSDGFFNWYGVNMSCVKMNVDPEFFAGMGTVLNGWE
jgi:hypothetical protein